MDKKIEAAIRETLVIGNPVSIKRCVDKLKLIFEQEQALQQADVSGSLPSNQQFNSIPSALLPHYFIRYPNKEGLTAACLHFLGDDAQKWYAARRHYH